MLHISVTRSTNSYRVHVTILRKHDKIICTFFAEGKPTISAPIHAAHYEFEFSIAVMTLYTKMTRHPHGWLFGQKRGSCIFFNGFGQGLILF